MINYLIYISLFIFKKFHRHKYTDFFSSPPQSNTLFFSNHLAQHVEGVYSIESLMTLNTLLTEKRTTNQPASIRFLVDKMGKAWFANETLTGISAPKHFQMTGMAQKKSSCKAAGNMKFTHSCCTVLKNITHQSGDFHPNFQSLKWLLAILIIHEARLPFKLPRILIVKELDTQGKLKTKHYWTILKIKQWVTTFSEDHALMTILKDQNQPARLIDYKSPDRNVLNHNDSVHFLDAVNPSTYEACSRSVLLE